MHPTIDYMGPQGGALAMAFAAGCMVTGTALLTAGAIIWRMMFNPRIKSVETQLETERRDFREALRDEREQCARQIEQLRDRIVQLETMLSLHGSPALRQAVQAVVSEQRVAADIARHADQTHRIE